MSSCCRLSLLAPPSLAVRYCMHTPTTSLLSTTHQRPVRLRHLHWLYVVLVFCLLSLQCVNAQTIASVTPFRGPKSGGTTLVIVGSGLNSASPLYCVFDGQSVQAVQVSGTNAQCVSPRSLIAPSNTSEWSAVFDITYDNTTLVSYESGGSALPFVYDNVTVGAVSVLSGPARGGTVVNVTVDGLYNDTSYLCSFGNWSDPVAAVLLSSHVVQCITPVQPDQTVSATVVVGVSTNGGQQWYNASQPFLLYASDQIASIAPPFGPQSAHDILTVTGSGFLNQSSLVCQLYNQSSLPAVVVPATYLSPFNLTCQLPASSQSIVVLVSTSNNGVDFTPSTVYYSWINNPAVYAVAPSIALYESRPNVTVYGANFTSSISSGSIAGSIVCSIDGTVVVPAVYMNATAVVCEMPVLSVGNHTIELSFNGVDFTNNSVQFDATPLPVVSLIQPPVAVQSTTRLTIEGSNYHNLSTIYCAFEPVTDPANVTVAAATYVSAVEMSCLTPALELGQYVLEVSMDGTYYSTSGKTVNVTSALNLTAISPFRGPKSGGTTLAISGVQLNSTQPIYCVFDGVSAEATQYSSTFITCVSPASALAAADTSEYSSVFSVTYNLVDTVPYVVNGTRQAFVYDNVTVGAVSVLSGPARGGTVVNVTVDGLYNDTSYLCSFGNWSDPVAAVLLSSHVVQCITPVQPDQTVSATVVVGVSTNGGQQWYNASQPFLLYASDQIASIAPPFGPQSAHDILTVTGSGFLNQSSLVCQLYNQSSLPAVVVPATYLSPFNLTCQLPASSQSIVVLVSTSNNGVDFTPSTVYYSWINNPAVYAVAPSIALYESRPNVTVYGANFTSSISSGSIAGSIVCSIDGTVVVPAVYMNATAVVCEMPVLSVGNHTIELSFNGVDFTNNSVQFDATPLPVVSLIQPPVAVQSTTRLTIEGSNYHNLSTIYCAFEPVTDPANVTVAAATYVSAVEMSCLTPALELGQYVLEVSMDGTYYSTSGKTVNVTSALNLTAISPFRGPKSGGTTLAISGVQLNSTQPIYCVFDGVSAEATQYSSTFITCVSPASALAAADTSEYSSVFSVTYNLVDTVPYVVNGTRQAFVYDNVTVGAVSVLSGPARGGTVVNVTVDGLYNDTSYLCSFGNWSDPVAAVLLSSHVVQCITPVQPDQTVSATVVVGVSTNGGQQWYNASQPFLLYASDQIASIAPPFGPQSAHDILTVTGSGFLNQSSLVCQLYNQSSLPAVVVPATYLSPFNLTCQLPASSQSIVVLVSTSNNGVDFTPSTVYYSWINNPAVYAVAPSIALYESRPNVTVYGANFTSSISSGSIAGSIVCSIDGTVVVPAVYMNATAVVCEMPVLSVGNHTIELSFNGVDFTNNSVQFDATPLPVVSLIQPPVAVQSTTRLTIEGSNYHNLSTIYCAFEPVTDPANVTVAAATYVSAVEMSCLTPALELGQYVLEVSMDGTYYSTSGKTVNVTSALNLTAISPFRGPKSGGTTLAISGVQLNSTQPIYCVFDGVSAEATQYSSTFITCVSPASALAAADTSEYSSVFSVTYNLVDTVPYVVNGTRQAFVYDNVTVGAVSVLSGPARGGTVVNVTVDGLYNDTSYLCSFGNWSDPVAAVLLSSHVVQCITPVQPDQTVSATVVVGVSTNGGQQWYNASQPFLLYASDQIASIAPPFGPQSAHDILTVTGSGFLNQSSLVCQLYNQSSLPAVVVPATYLSPFNLTCQLPASSQSIVVLVSTSNNGVDFTPSTVYYSWINNPAVYAVAPSIALYESRPNVTVYGANFTSSISSGSIAGSIVCSIDGTVVVPAVYMNATAVVCEMPVLSVGNHTIELSFNGVDFTNNSVQFDATPLPVVSLIQPPVAVQSTTRLTIEGSNYHNLSTIYCAFEPVTDPANVTVAAATYVSAVEMSCLTPALELGQYVLEVSMDGTYYSTSGLTVEVTSPILFTSVYPLLTPIGAVNTMTLYGSNFFNSPYLLVLVGGVLCPVLTYIDTSEVTCTVPLSSTAGTVSVTVSNNGGVDVVTVPAAFTYTPLPVLSSLSPTLGPVVGGTLVTLKGSNLNLSASVWVVADGERLPAVGIDNSTVTFMSPAGLSVGWIEVNVSYNDGGTNAGEGFYSNQLSFYYYDMQITDLVPALGPTTGGTLVSLTGTNFVSPTVHPDASLVCTFGSSMVPATYVSSTSINCIAPVHAAGGVTVSLSANAVDFTQNSVEFYYQPPVVLTSLTPTLGSNDVATNLTISGSPFYSSYDLYCLIDGLHVTAEYVLNSTLLCTVPAGLPLGAMSVAVTYNGQDYSPALSFTAVQPASVVSVSPNITRTFGVTEIEVTGFNFLDVPSLSCVINGSCIPATYINSTTLTCISLPVPEAGSLAVEVSLNGQSVSSDGVQLEYIVADPNLASTYTVYEGHSVFPNGPEIETLSLYFGPREGGTVLTVAGVGFVVDVTMCVFVGVGSVPSIVQNVQQTVCTTPPNPTGGARVLVRLTNDGVNMSESSVGFEYYTSPVLTAVALPTATASGPEAGNTVPVIIAGVHFLRLPPLLCRFGAQSVAGTWRSDKLVACVPPDQSPQTVNVSVSLNGVDYSSSVTTFTYQPLSSVLSVSPTTSPMRGGVMLTVSGGNFLVLSSHSLYCLVGSAPTVRIFASVVDDGTLLCQTPSTTDLGWSTGAAALSVESDHQLVSSGVSSIAYYADYYVTSLGLYSSPVGVASLVLVSGTNFFSGNGISCRFGGSVFAGSFDSSTTLLCVLPTTLSAGMYAVDVSCNGFDWTSSGQQYEVYEQPTISDLYPSSGAVEGGTLVRVRGSGFIPLASVTCQFDSAVVSGLSAVSVTSPTELWCIAPAAALYAAGSVTVSVSLNGVDYTFNAPPLVFTYFEAPTLLTMLPAVGESTGQLLVTLTGSNFVDSADLSCEFTAGSLFSQSVAATWVSSTELTCLTPAVPGSSLTANVLVVAVDVTNNGVDVTDAPLSFRYERLPAVTLISPDVGAAAGGPSVVLSTTDATGFSSTGCCSFDTISPPRPAYVVPWTRTSASTVVCVTPAQYVTTVGVAISTSDCSSYAHQSVEYMYAPTPTISSLSPSSGQLSGGFSVSITGSFLPPFSSPACLLSGAGQGSGGVLSPSLFVCTVPALTSGSVTLPYTSQLSVTLDGHYYTSPLPFVYLEQPTVLPVSPLVLPTSYSLLITLIGSNFIDQPTLSCVFGGAGVTPANFISTTQVTCTAPTELSASIMSVEMTNDGESVTSSGHTVTYYVPPTTLSITPPSGPLTGGLAVTVFGSSFVSGNVACSWLDGVWTSTAATRLNSTAVTCTIPAYYDLVDGGATEHSATQMRVVDLSGYYAGDPIGFAYEPLPVLTLLSPAFTYDADSSLPAITLAGSNFLPTSLLACQFGSFLSSAVWLDRQTVVCNAPTTGMLISVLLRVTVHQTGDWSNALPFTYNAQPTVQHIAPTLGSVNGGTLVTVTGSNFINTVDAFCTFGPHLVAAAVQSPTQLACVAPSIVASNASNAVVVAVEVSFNRVVWTADGRMFTYLPDALPLSVSPARGSVAGGYTVLVTGMRFIANESQCSFAGLLSLNSTVQSSSAMLCKVPAYFNLAIIAPVVVALSVVQSSIGAAQMPSVLYTYMPLPSLVSVYPINGSTAGGTTLTLTGASFASTTTYNCLVGGATQSAKRVNSATITCATPVHVAGSVSVTVLDTALSVSSNPLTFLFTAPITLLSLSPSIGSYHGGSVVTVHGSGFFSSSLSSWCLFGGVVYVPAVFVNSTAMTCVTPAYNSSGVVSVELTLNSADFTTSGLQLTLARVPRLYSLQPNHGPALVRTLVSITGAYFTASSLCAFSGVTSNTTVVTSSQAITCVAPVSFGESSVDVTVYDSSVQVWALDALPFAYDSQMVITAVTPSQLYFPALTVLTISGSSFPSSATDLNCVLSGSVAVPASFVSTNVVTCPSPILPPGSYDIELSYSQSIDYSDSGVIVQYMLNQPSVTAISPAYAATATAVTVTVSGVNFIASPSLACLFQQEQLSAHYVSSNTVTCLLPAQASTGAYPVEVTLNGVEWTIQDVSITYVSLPFVLSVLPSSGPVSGGTVVIISGLLFSSDAVVHFGSFVVTPSYIDSMTLQAVAPAVAAPQSVSVEVAVAGVVVTSDRVQFVYVASVVLTQLSPTTALEMGGDTLLIYSTASFIDSAALQCSFTPPSASAVVVPATFISFSLLWCVSPASVNGLGAGTVSVSNNGQDWSAALSFTYVSPAFLFSLSPAIVPSLASFSLTVFGSGFSGEQLDTCVIDGALFATSGASSDSTVVCWIGVALPAGTLDVSLTSTQFNPHAAYTLAQPRVYSPFILQLQVVATPVVLSLFPTAGSVSGGTELTVQGINFDVVNGVQCVFGTTSPFIAYTTANLQSATQLTCLTPPSPTHSSGAVVVQLSSAALTNLPALNETNKHFTYYQPFQVDSAFPLSLPAYTTSTITVIGTDFPINPPVMAVFGSALPTLPAASTVSALSSVYSGLNALGYVSCVVLNSSWLECPTPAIDLPFRTTVRLTANLVDFTSAITLTFHALPVVLSINPTLGPTTGGTLLTVYGSGFHNFATLVCSFGSIVHPATYVSPVEVTCSTPPHGE